MCATFTYLDSDWVWNWLGYWHNLRYWDDVRLWDLHHVGLWHWLWNWHWLSHWDVFQYWVWSINVLDNRNNHMLRYKFCYWQLLKYWIWLKYRIRLMYWISFHVRNFFSDVLDNYLNWTSVLSVIMVLTTLSLVSIGLRWGHLGSIAHLGVAAMA